ncbi:MAG: HNH endonuclease family protein [Propionicimonas sp.]
MLVVILVIVAAAVIVLNRGTISSLIPGPAPAGNSLLISSPADVAEARGLIDRLRVEDRPASLGDYRRAAFGDAWTDTDGNGCNQRDDVLWRDVVKTAPYTAARQRECDHDMVAGTWVDPYTGDATTLTDAKQQDQAESVQIDHIVPLSVAWRYGAKAWSDAERLQFANDLRNLAAVGGAANQAKGGSDASAWRPIRAAECGYAVRYIVVKSAYALPTDPSEKRALAEMLTTCP